MTATAFLSPDSCPLPHFCTVLRTRFALLFLRFDQSGRGNPAPTARFTILFSRHYFILAPLLLPCIVPPFSHCFSLSAPLSSLHTAHHLLSTVHLPSTTHHPFSTLRLLLTIYRSPITDHRSPITAPFFQSLIDCIKTQIFVS